MTIYSTGVLGAFFGQVLAFGFMLLLGVIGLTTARSRSKDSKEGPQRGLAVISGVILLLAAAGLAAVAVVIVNGRDTFVGRATDAEEVDVSCGTDADTSRTGCVSHLLTLVAGGVTYRIDVDADALAAVEIGGCYRVERYPAGLFDGGLSEDPTSRFVEVKHATSVQDVDCQADLSSMAR